MNWLGRLLGLTSDQDRKFWRSFIGNTWAGESVTPNKAMMIAAVWRAIRLTAETVATLPLSIYELNPNGTSRQVRDPSNQYDALLRVSPNEYQTKVEFWEAMVGCELLLGNGYASKDMVGDRIVSLTLLNPETTWPWRDPSTNKLTYRSIDWRGRSVVYQPDEVLHLKGFGFGGDCGLSAVQFGAQSLGATIAAEKTSAKLIGSGLSNSGFIESTGVLNEGDRTKFDKILEDYRGSDNAGKIMILEGGMKFTSVQMNAVDAQLLAKMQFDIEEVGRWFGMPPVLLGHNAQGQTMWGTGVEQIIVAWYTLGLRALLTRIETTISKRLISDADRGRFYAKFNVDALLRGDSQTQASVMASNAQNGIRTRNELRALLDLEPIAGADELTAQTNLAPLSQLRENSAPANQLRAALRAFLIEEEPKAPDKRAAA